MRTTVRDIVRMKQAGERIAVLTSYDYPSAKLAEKAGVKVLLVGDSLGTVVHGHQTTLLVTLDDMIRHAAAVVRGSDQALVICDLPFLSYASLDQTVESARRVMQETGVQAVKLEGGAPVVPMVRHLVEHGVPVVGHLGYVPQSQYQLGVRVQAKDAAGARQLIADAHALEQAGAFAIVLELVPAPLARAVSQQLRIPTIGIGAGAGCDGQVQVWHDILGLGEWSPRHSKRFGDIGDAIEKAIADYVAEVAAGSFPTDAQSSGMDEEQLALALGPHA